MQERNVMSANDDKLMGISEAARRLGVHQNTLRTWADKRLIKTVKLPSGHRRFTTAEVERMRVEMGFGSTLDDERAISEGDTAAAIDLT